MAIIENRFQRKWNAIMTLIQQKNCIILGDLYLLNIDTNIYVSLIRNIFQLKIINRGDKLDLI